MAGYTKLFNSILDSTVWGESKDVRILWVTMLAMADRNGEVAAALPGLTRRAQLTQDETEVALARLMAPDPHSRTPDHEGRRVEAIPGGWQLLNYAIYRARMSREDQQERNREAVRKCREKKKAARTEPPPLNPPAETGSGPLLPDAPTPAQLLAREWMATQGRYKGDEARQLADLPKWAKALEDMTRLDGVLWDDVEALARWVMRDVETHPAPGGNGAWRGWGTVIQSPMKLRSKNRDGARYHEVIAEKINRGEKPSARRSSISNDPKDYRPEDNIDFDAPLPDIVRKPKTDQRHQDDIDF